MQGLQDISIGSKLKEQCKDVKEVPVKENLLFLYDVFCKHEQYVCIEF